MSRTIKQEDVEMKDRDEDASSFTKKETVKVENEEDHESPQRQLPQSAVLPESTHNSSLQDNHESGSMPTSHPQTNQTTNLTSTVQTSSTKKETAKIENEEEHKSPQPQLPPSAVLPEPTRNTSIQDNHGSGSIPTSQPPQNQTTNLTFLIHTPSTWAADFGDHPKARRRARPAQQTTIQSSSSGKLPVSSVEKSHEDPTAGSRSVWATNKRDRSSTPLNVGESSPSRYTGISNGDPSSSKRVFQKQAIRTIQPRPSDSSRNVHNFPPAVKGSSSVSGSIVQATQPHGDYRPALASSSRSTRPDPVPLPDLTPLTRFIFDEDVIRQFLDVFTQTDFERILYTPLQLHDLRSQLVWGADGRINQIEKNKIHDSVNNQIVTSKLDLPVEMCDMVGSFLPRDDVLNLRLVDKSTEMLFSGLAFRSVVVPFRPEIYRMLAMDQSALFIPAGITKSNLNDKGKGKAPLVPSDEDLSIQTRLAKLRGNDYDGMKIFKAWGSHIRKFAMTFDLDQASLENPPKKGLFEKVESFWGSYMWPHEDYTRYLTCESLEKRADETKLMTKALSYLGEVVELAISVDDGLGWIAGPDTSDRARIFAEKRQIFGAQHPPSNKNSLDRLHEWRDMTEFVSLDTVWISKPQSDEPWGFNAPYAVIGSAYPQVIIPPVRRQSCRFPPLIFNDEDYETEDRSSEGWPSHGRPSFPKASLVPNALKPAQKEWLLENYWAQDAFLTSWSLAVMDNTATFSHLRTLNIAFISSKHLDTLQRPDFWKALVSVQSLCLMVSPDWLDIAKAEDQSVETWELLPSHAAHKFYKFLESCIRETSNIGTLKIGYVGGGERASGMFARNRNVLPAPIIDFGQQRSDVAHVDNVMTLPYVQDLTLCNCWMTPDTLKEFVGKMKLHRLSSLVLDSVSLTAQPPRDPLPTYPSMYPRAFWGKQGQRRFHTTDGSLNDARPGPRLGPIAPATLENIRWFLFEQGMSTTLFDGPWDAEDTDNEWRHRTPPFGTWADVVNTITPGENLVRKRYTHGITHKVPAPRFNGSLKRIEFISCGYIRLPKLTAFVQTSLGGISDCSIIKLRGRNTELAEVMMSRRQEVFLGQIVPSIRWEEVCFLRGAFNLRPGWHREDMSKYNNREDGQPLGGSGRFSGIVEEVKDPRAT